MKVASENIFGETVAVRVRAKAQSDVVSSDAIGDSAARHGRELVDVGFSLSQVVHDYGDICQAVTELALEQAAPITTQEFHTLNRCLDTAIAEAVTEHGRMTAERTSAAETERFGQVAHEIRDLLNTSLLAFEVLKQGTVAVNGSTGAVLGRSLLGLRGLVENALTDIRLHAAQQQQRVPIDALLSEVVAAGRLHAEHHAIEFTVEPIDTELAVIGDPQLLASAIANLLNNAFKYTRAGGRVVVRAQAADARLLLEIEDECGGIAGPTGDLFQPFGERRGRDRTGLGLGLSMARKAVRAHDGEIHIRNHPGKGCVFVIDVPRASAIAVPNVAIAE